MRNLIFFLMLSLLISGGCAQNQITVGWYIAEGVGLAGYDRYKRSDDVVLVKGASGQSNFLCMRRGFNKLWGPSENLETKSGLGFWEYKEDNRRIQIYDNVGVAHYGKYKFEMTDEAKEEWAKFQKWMAEKYKTQTDYIMYEHLLRNKAKLNEATSEFKQEKKMFSERNN